MLDRTIYSYPNDAISDNPIDEYNNNFQNAESHITLVNNETNGGDNTQIMTLAGDNVNNQNRVSVLEGKFEVESGKYRIALQCRNRGALYLSYDGGKTFELGCQVLFECAE